MPTRRAVRPNLRGSPKESTYSTARSVVPSASHHSSMPVLETSSMPPSQANDEIPMPSRDKCSSSAIPTPPDWAITPVRPGTG